MTGNQSEQTKESIQAAVSPVNRIARIIEDPFESALLATVSVSLAVTVVLSGMGIVQVFLG